MFVYSSSQWSSVKYTMVFNINLNACIQKTLIYVFKSYLIP